MSQKPTYQELQQRIQELERSESERNEAEQMLRESKELLSSIFRSAPIGIGLVIDRVLQQVNSRLCEILGYREEDLIGRSSRILYSSDKDFEFVGRKKYAQIRDHGTGTVETHWQRKDGAIFDVLLSSTPIDLQDHSKGVTFTALDITERKQAEERLRELEERFRLTFYTSPDAVNINTMDGIYLDINEGFTQLTGYTRQEAIGKSSADINIWDIPEDRDRLIEGLKRKGYVRNLESRFLMKDGSYRIALMSATIIQLKGVPHILSITRDISDFRKTEQEKLVLEKQLLQAQKMESIGRLAGGVAHDFNNMLGVILGHAELAMEALDQDQPIFNDLQQIQQAAKRSNDITRQLLAFARKQIVSPKVIDLNDTVAGILKMLLRLIGEDIDLAWLPGKGLWPIKIDPAQIDQILANLCINARDAITGVGKITVETENCTLDKEYCSTHAGFSSGDYVKMVVSDNGSGMEKETVSHVFEPFFTTKGVNEGTGLGLATVYGIVRQNSGFINVYSEQGQGTTFTIYLPRHEDTANQKQSESTAEPVLPGNETILLVEDEPTILNMTTSMLQRLGYTVLAADTPGNAIRLAGDQSKEIHLLLTDVIMPEMNGRILQENLLINRPDLKCLFMSGYTANVISHHGVLEDGVSFLQKQFTKRELAAKIRSALSKNEGYS